MPSFLANGSDIIANAVVSSDSSSGQDGAGQITVQSGSQIFPDDYIVEFIIDEVDANGEINGQSGFTGIRVYASVDDYNNGITTYTYNP